MNLRIGTCQLPSEAYGAETILAYLSLADEKKLDVICFPEGYINGYTYDENEARARAVDVSSTTFRGYLTQWAEHETTFVAGVIEKEGNNLYNTAVVVRGGQLIGKYRKTHPNEGIFVAGTEYPVFTVKGIQCGINICYDANFPEAAQRLVNQGAKLIFYPLNNVLRKSTADRWRTKHIQNLIDRAQGTGAWVISSDVIADGGEHVGYGCTAIVSPQGKVVARAPELTEALEVYEIEI